MNGLSLLLVERLLEGFEIGDWGALLVLSFLLGFANAFVIPLLKFLTFPITVITLGLWSLILNFLLFLFLVNLVEGVDVHGVWWAVAAWMLYSVVVTLLGFAVRG